MIWPRAALLVVAAVLAGCPMAPPGRGGVPGLTISARTVGSPADIVEVEAVHSSLNDRIERVELIGPDGKTYPASEMRTEITRDTSYGPSGTLGVGGSERHVFTGIGLSFPLAGYGPSQTFRTRALVRIPDAAAYARDYAQWKVAVTVGNRSGQTQTIVEPAPKPR